MAFIKPQMTDTGTSSSVVVTPTAKASTPTTSKTSTVKKTTNTATPTTTTVTPTQTVTPTAVASSGGGSSSGGGGGGGGEEVQYNAENWNKYLDDLNKLYRNAYEGAVNKANDYQTQAQANAANSEQAWNTAYQRIVDAINQQQAQNTARENAINQAIQQGYDLLTQNANDYYNNVLGTYNRSMDYVNQGFEEGKSTSEQARDEAIQLAAALYEMGEATQNRQTERDLRNQYISYMNGLKNMNQRLASQGINGGASETALLSALNGYEANRTDLDEARLAALGLLRQEEMKSNSQAQQTYLSALADLISNRTNQQLSVENTRSSGESNYANMKNDAINTRSNQTLQAQQAFQNWANELMNARNSNEQSYASGIRDINNDKTDIAKTFQQMYANALDQRSQNYSSSGVVSAIENLSANGKTVKTNINTKNKTKKQKKAEQAKKAASKSSSKKSSKKTTKKK